MTRAAPPAVSGDASLVPPKSSIGDGEPLNAVQPAKRTGSGVHSAQPSWPGATRSTTRPRSSTPPDEIGEALSLAHEVAKLRVPRVDEFGEVVDLAALRGDGAGVAEGLGPDAAEVRVGAGEVLVVREHRGAVGPDEVRVVDVQAVSDPGHLHSGAVHQVLRLG